MLGIAVVLGLVEGLTEFLPISSTGHLIVTSDLLGFEGRRAEVFQIFIQLGAILSVVWEYRARLGRLAVDLPRSAAARGFAGKLGLAFVPSALLGLLTHDLLLASLFSSGTVALALIAGAALILVVESLTLRVRTHEAESTTWPQALGIGLAQCLALWPGFSRSAATILGGLATGLDRRAATEFSFFLAIPTMFAATLYNLYKQWRFLEPGDALWLALSFAVSFFVAWGSIRWLLRFVATHSFRPFAWYRIALGILVLVWIDRV
jgi:undecaprenyl-diphosphatase